MLTVATLSHTAGDSFLFDNLTFSINQNDRIGIVGPNGAGKSTLLRIISGELVPENGSRTVDPGVRIGYLPQGSLDLERGTMRAALDPASGGFFSAQRELEAAVRALAGPDGADMDVIDRWERALADYEAAGGYAAADRLEAHLARFALPADALSRPRSQLSGGERTRAALATMLAMRPDILLLDEPTNHLDLDAQRWLIDVIVGYPGAVVVVSHDRAFLQETVTRIVAFDALSSEVDVFSGGYDAWIDTRRKREVAEFERWKRQQEKISGLQASIDQHERSARKVENETIHFHYRKRAAKVARAATVRRARLDRMLESEELVEKPRQQWGLALEFPAPDVRARDVVRLDGIVVERAANRVLDGVSLTLRYGERLALTGPNGAGKTTLLQVVIGELEPDRGIRQLAPGVRVGVLAQDQETLDPRRTVLESVQALVSASESELRTELHRYLFGGDIVHQRVADLSFGERTRLMLALIAIPGADLLLLDEPHNHLDLDARAAFEEALQAFPGAVLLISHDRYAIQQVATRVVRIDGGRLEEVDVAVDPEFVKPQLQLSSAPEASGRDAGYGF